MGRRPVPEAVYRVVVKSRRLLYVVEDSSPMYHVHRLR
jgi:hypothetical protein